MSSRKNVSFCWDGSITSCHYCLVHLYFVIWHNSVWIYPIHPTFAFGLWSLFFLSVSCYRWLKNINFQWDGCRLSGCFGNIRNIQSSQTCRQSMTIVSALKGKLLFRQVLQFSQNRQILIKIHTSAYHTILSNESEISVKFSPLLICSRSVIKPSQCLASWFSCQEISWIFDVCCQDLGNSWQGSQDFARFFKIVERNPRIFLDFLATKSRISKILAREKEIVASK